MEILFNGTISPPPYIFLRVVWPPTRQGGGGSIISLRPTSRLKILLLVPIPVIILWKYTVETALIIMEAVEDGSQSNMVIPLLATVVPVHGMVIMGSVVRVVLRAIMIR